MPRKPSPLCARCGKQGASVPPLCGRCRGNDRRRAEAEERRRLPIPQQHHERTPDEQAAAEATVARWKAMTDDERAAAVRDALN